MGDPPSPTPQPPEVGPPLLGDRINADARDALHHNQQPPGRVTEYTLRTRAYLIPPPPGILSLHRLKRDPVYVRVILPDKSEQTIAMGASTVEQVLVLLGVNPIEVIVSRNGRLVPDDAQVSGDDEIRIIRIAHGG